MSVVYGGRWLALFLTPNDEIGIHNKEVPCVRQKETHYVNQEPNMDHHDPCS